MIIESSADEVGTTRCRRTLANGTGFWHTTFIGTNWILRGDDCGDARPGGDLPEAGSLYPMAFLVEMDPDSVTLPHFHTADQFQVVVGGSGALGSHALRPAAVHYTNAYSPYGPIQAGSEGLHYFTLRNAWDPGARFMPESRAELRGIIREHREVVGETEAAPSTVGPAAGATTKCAALIEPEADGLGSWHYRVPAGGQVTGPDPAKGRGQFWLVLSGGMAGGDGAILPPRSCIFVGPEGGAFTALAGPQGLEVLALQFPDRRPS